MSISNDATSDRKFRCSTFRTLRLSQQSARPRFAGLNGPISTKQSARDWYETPSTHVRKTETTGASSSPPRRGKSFSASRVPASTSSRITPEASELPSPERARCWELSICIFTTPDTKAPASYSSAGLRFTKSHNSRFNRGTNSSDTRICDPKTCASFLGGQPVLPRPNVIERRARQLRSTRALPLSVDQRGQVEHSRPSHHRDRRAPTVECRCEVA